MSVLLLPLIHYIRLMKLKLLFLALICSFLSFGQNGTVVVNDENLGESFSQDILLLEDPTSELTLEAIRELPDDAFTSPEKKVPNLDFTTSSWWVKFKLKNESSFSHFIIETGRPITNSVKFYQLRGSKIENEFSSGDDFPFSEKTIPHSKNIFPVVMYPGQTKEYIINLRSDGEVITLPLKISDRLSFFKADATYQFSFGFYYGIMALVVVIYFFFFILLKDKAFLFYIVYVASQALLQFGLDGYAYRYLFPAGGYMANHFIILIAGFTILILLKYVDEFLSLAEHNKLMVKVFKVCQLLVVITMAMSLIPGITYEIGYPIINGVSLLSIVLSVVAIYRLRYKGVKVDFFFTVAFTVLIIGAIIFILGNFNIVGNAGIAQNALKISSALEVAILSISMSNKYRRLQKEKQEAQAVAMKALEEQNALMEGMNVKLEAQVKERTAEIEKQKEELAEINTEILSSIQYAERIQRAILPTDEQVQNILPESFIFYKPKDVVSGDFYFIEKTHRNNGEELLLFSAVDCTGHGVPGAFMSIVGNNFLSQSLTEKEVNTTGQALEFLNQGVNNTLHQDGKNVEGKVRDGMDISLCAFDPKSRKLYFSGAKNPVWIVRTVKDGEDPGFGDSDSKRLLQSEGNPNCYLFEIKGDAHPIGAYVGEELKPFQTHEVDVRPGDLVYLFSDGYADQFGGPNGKKYKYKPFKKFLMSISHLSMDEQRKQLIAEYENWKKGYEQIDDVIVLGVKIV